MFTEQSAKGTFIRQNGELKKVLKKLKIDTPEIWDKILADKGSVQDIKELDGYYYDLSLIHISEPTRPERIWYCGVWVEKK